MQITLAKSVGGRRAANRPVDVKKVQTALTQYLYLMPPVRFITDRSGTCGPSTIATIKRFQRIVQGVRNPDGVISPAGSTLKVLNGLSGAGSLGATRYHYPAYAQQELADIAGKYTGHRAARGMRMGNDPVMRRIFEADTRTVNNRTDGYNWCSAFVSMCLQEFLKKHRSDYAHVEPPREAYVHWLYTRWAPSQNCLIIPAGSKTYEPARGDIAIFNLRGSDLTKQMAHIGIVEEYVDETSIFTIEGNTNARKSASGGEIRMNEHKLSKFRVFIRLPLIKKGSAGQRAYNEMVTNLQSELDGKMAGVLQRQIAGIAKIPVMP